MPPAKQSTQGDDPLWPPTSLGHVLVTGGCGFLGGHIVQTLLDRKVCTKITALDLRPASEPKKGVNYEFGDITDESAMREVFSKLKPAVVIHSASPHFNMNDKSIMYKVNVEGTQVLLKVAQESGVKSFVYTSSASIVHDTNSNLIYADETYPIIPTDKQPEYYSATKAMAESKVLAANRPADKPHFTTCALRPSGITGPGDVQMVPKMMGIYYKGQSKFVIGDNENLFDYTDVRNVAHAHHLAAAMLIATSDREGSGGSRPIDTERVDGEAFFITNDTPVYFFDYPRMVYRECGDTLRAQSAWVIPKDFGLILATLFEWVYFIFRLGKPNVNRQQIKYGCMVRYFNIDKAKLRLGYRTIVELDQTAKDAVAYAIKYDMCPEMPAHLKPSQESKKSR